MTTPPPTGEPLTITTPPINAYVGLGSTATFSVTATGTGPLQYQWDENGGPIAGATGASYTTPVVQPEDTGASFEVTVSDASSSVVSSMATLTVGPRLPKPGDLRYLLSEQISAPGLGNDGGQITNITSETALSFDNAIGTPIMHGDTCYSTINCDWGLDVNNLPPGTTSLNMFYKPDSFSNFDSDLASWLGPNAVLTGVDFQIPFNEFAASWVETSASVPFDVRREVVDPSQAQATATDDGAASRVITAVAYDGSGKVNLFSYGWQGDTSTVYDNQVVMTTAAGVISAATQLAGEGYAISAFGGNDSPGYILVGTRVQGDTLPRPISGGSNSVTIKPTNPGPGYYTVVVDLTQNGGGTTLISEQ